MTVKENNKNGFFGSFGGSFVPENIQQKHQ